MTLKKNTVYYLEEIEAPEGYQIDSTLYSFVISDDPNHANYTRDDGVWVYYVGDILKIRNYPEQLKLEITKRFAGNVTLTAEQKAKIKFVVEQLDESGNVMSDGKRWEIPYSLMSYDKYTITDEDGLVPGNYKVTEIYTEDLGLGENVVAETSYSVTAEGTTVTGNDQEIPSAPVTAGKTTSIIFKNTYSTGA